MAKRSIGRNAIKAKERTLKVIRDFFNYASWLNDEFVDEAANPNHLSTIDYIENKLKEMCFHSGCSDAVIRLEPIIMSIALHLGFEQERQNGDKLNRLYSIINYIKTHYKDKDFKSQLNSYTIENTTYDSLNKEYGDIIDKLNEDENKESNSIEDNQINPDYQVIHIDSYEQAHEIGNYSHSKSKLCYTQNLSTWNQYTRNGLYNPYCILRKNYKEIDENTFGDDAKHDDSYGTSMIFLFISPKNEIVYSNSRYNHKATDVSLVDNSFNKVDISKLLNCNFSSLFKGVENFHYVINNVSLFTRNGYAFVRRNDNLMNVINENGKLMFEGHWMVGVIPLKDYRFACKFEGGDNRGWYVCDMANKFQYALHERIGFIRVDDSTYFIVKAIGKCNVNNLDSDKPDFVFGNKWYSNIILLCDSIIRVKLDNGKYKVINLKNRDIKIDDEFDSVNSIYPDYIVCKKGDKYFLYDKEFNLLLESNYAIVRKTLNGFIVKDTTKTNKTSSEKLSFNEYCNYVDLNGNIKFNKWNIWSEINENVFTIYDDDGYFNLCGLDGKVILDKWYHDITRFGSVYYCRDYCYSIDLFDFEFNKIASFDSSYDLLDNCNPFRYKKLNLYSYILFKKGNVCNLFDVKNSNFKFNIWYENIEGEKICGEECFIVRFNGKKNIIKGNKYLLKRWYKDINIYFDDVISVEYDDGTSGVFKPNCENDFDNFHYGMIGIPTEDITLCKLKNIEPCNLFMFMHISNFEIINFFKDRQFPILADSYFEDVTRIDDRYSVVKNNNRYNVVDLQNEKFIFNDWLDDFVDTRIKFSLYLRDNGEYLFNDDSYDNIRYLL
jgi:hypothetical protein